MAGTATPMAGAPPAEQEVVAKVVAQAESFEDGIGKDFRDRCNRFYRQYRGFSKVRQEWQRQERDRDVITSESVDQWGADLHIPMSFRTIETMVPKAIAHRPRMLVLPRLPQWEMNAQAVQQLLDVQQDQIDIDLAFQAVMRAGCIYGLGVGKSYWRRETAPRRTVESRLFRGGYALGQQREVTTFDDPMFEDVDPFDFFWDPRGSSIETCRWVIHRVWLSTAQVLQRVQDGRWGTASAQLLDEQKVRSMGGRAKYDEVWDDRMSASGLSGFSTTQADPPHEVLEFHDGRNLITVLDRECLVQAAESPSMGHIPFCVYRPIPLQKQMVGIGYLEPLEHLQRELNTLRSQRRDLVTMALNAGYAYDEAAIDPEDLRFGPGVVIPVTNANPGSALLPLQVRDVSGSGYQEEQSILHDIDVISGVSDQNDQSGSAQTATGAMMYQAAVGQRIGLQSRRFEIEVVRSTARVWLVLDQRMITEDRQVRQTNEGAMQDEPGDGNVSKWKWADIGPGELRGEYELVCEGGSMAMRNVPQDRQDAVQLLQTLGSQPEVDRRRVLTEAIKLFGFKDAPAWLVAKEKPVPPAALQMLQDMGVDPNLIQMAVTRAQQSDPMLPAETAGQEDVQMRPEAVQGQ